MPPPKRVRVKMSDIKERYHGTLTGYKKFNIGNNPRGSWQSLLDEMAKCEVFCANCHRIREHNRKEALRAAEETG